MEHILRNVLFVCNFTKTAGCHAKIPLKITFHSKPLAPSKIILNYKDWWRIIMKINSINKKLANNLVLGSSLYGISVGIITQVQATQRRYTPTQKVFKYMESAICILETKLSERNLSREECIRLVRDDNGDPNAQGHFWFKEQNESLTLLEEAILSRYPEALEIFIAHGADVCEVSSEIKKAFGNEVTLLHLALLTPDEMQALDKIKSVGIQNHATVGIVQAFREQQSREFLKKMGLDQMEEAVPPPGLYVPRKVLELLMKELSAKQELSSKLNAKDKNGKTILDLAVERYLALVLNPEILTIDPQTPIAELKIPILNLQIKESDQQMKKEYEDVINWLLLDVEKMYNLEPKCIINNNKSYSLIVQLEGQGKEVLHPIIQRDLTLKRQKGQNFQSLQLKYLQTLLIQRKQNVQGTEI
ncbi:MAG: hypothetical protein LBD60_04370 [Puniceicoccales bacterium]|jgi:hypothetical protein|nr:hypothetical protein [Puniceicoccales bacterium]